jgi:YecR-like lipoprotein
MGMMGLSYPGALMNRSIQRLILLPATLVMGLSACVSTQQGLHTGGDKDAGLVRVSYQYSQFHQPKVDDAQTMTLAENRCSAWGYQRAEPVAGLVRECSNMEGGNCDLWTVTREFQCSSGAKDGNASYATRLSR